MGSVTGAFCAQTAIANAIDSVAVNISIRFSFFLVRSSSPISVSPMFALHRQSGTFRISTKLEMEPVKKARRDGAHDRGQVPQEVRLEIIEHDAGGKRSERIRNADG